MLGILGRKGVGKDLISDYLVKEYGYTKTAFANPLKAAVQVLFDFNQEQLYGDQKEILDSRWGVTPRTVLQWLGTEIFRKQAHQLLPQIGNNFWTKRTLIQSASQKVVISDARFQNEVDQIRDQGGRVIKVIRPGIPRDNHESETGIDLIKSHDYLVINDGTVAELYMKIDQIMKRIDLESRDQEELHPWTMCDIRTAEKEDFPRIGELLLNSFRAYFTPTTNVSKREKQLTDIQTLSKETNIFVAVLGKKIVGIAAVNVDENPKYPEFPKKSAYLQQLVVDSEHRRKGIGKSLMKVVMNYAMNFGKTTLILRTAENMVEAQHTYKALGFSRRPDLDWKYPDLKLLCYIIDL